MVLNPHSSGPLWNPVKTPAFSATFLELGWRLLYLVCRPLDLGNVDTVFVHVPQRRQNAQLVDGFADFLRGVVDLLFGGETAERKADRAVCQFVVAAQGAQHVRRLKRGRGAGRTGRNRQVLERHDQRLAFDVVEAQIQVVRYTGGHAAVDVQLLKVLDLLVEAIAQRLDAHVFGSHVFFGYTEGFTHADDLVGRQGAGTHAALVTAAVHGSFDAHARLAAHVQRADAFRTVGLVGGERHQVDFQFRQVNVDLAGGLSRVDMQQDALGTGQLADGRNVVDGADFVVHVDHGNQDGVFTQRGLDHGRSHDTVGGWLEVGDLKTFTLQLAHGVEDSLVLNLGGDQVLAFGRVEMRRTLDCQVVGFGGTRGPDDFTRVGVDQICDLTTGVFDGLFSFPAEHMGTGRRVTEVSVDQQAFTHLLRDTRINRGGRRVIKVNRQFHGLSPNQAGWRAASSLAVIRRRTLQSCPGVAPCHCNGAGPDAGLLLAPHGELQGQP